MYLQLSKIFEPCVVSRGKDCIYTFMFKSIGVLVLLWYVSLLFANSIAAMDKAFSASFHSFETVAIASEKLFAK